MTTYQVTIDEASERRLYAISALLGCTVESLIEDAVEDAARDYFRHHGDDPARNHTPADRAYREASALQEAGR